MSAGPGTGLQEECADARARVVSELAGHLRKRKVPLRAAGLLSGPWHGDSGCGAACLFIVLPGEPSAREHRRILKLSQKFLSGPYAGMEILLLSEERYRQLRDYGGSLCIYAGARWNELA